MRVLACPASLKGVLDASAAADALREGFRLAGVGCDTLPLADGGEGTLDAIHAARGGAWHEAQVEDAFGRPRTARWLLLDDGTAVVEAAEAIPLDPAGSTSRTPPAAASACSCGRSAARAGSSSGSAGRRTWTRAPGCSTCSPRCPLPRWSRATSTRRWSRRRGCSARRRGRLPRTSRRWRSGSPRRGSRTCPAAARPGASAPPSPRSAPSSGPARRSCSTSSASIRGPTSSSSPARARSTGRPPAERRRGRSRAAARRRGVRCVVFGGRVEAPLPGAETVALSGDPARAADDLVELGRRLGSGLDRV